MMKLASKVEMRSHGPTQMAPIFSKQASKGRSIAPEPMNFVLKNGPIQSTALVMQSTALDLVRTDRIKICRPSGRSRTGERNFKPGSLFLSDVQIYTAQ
jgi:hypothetical protein